MSTVANDLRKPTGAQDTMGAKRIVNAANVTPLSGGAPERLLGALLVDAGRLTAVDAERVLQVQQEFGLRFGEAAIKLGLVTEAEIQQMLARQFEYPYLIAGESAISEEVVAAYQPFSARVEGLRALRTQLKMRWFDLAEGGRPLAIVSPERGDGRSFLAANLAVVFSQLGERTLLVDADLRHPRQQQLFGIPNTSGLSSLLAGRCDAPAIQRIPGLIDLSVLPAGPLPPNPAELLDRPAFSRLLEQFAQDYDAVLLDTAAGIGNSDAQAVAGRAQAGVMVVRKHRTRLANARALVSALHATEMLGTVVNEF